MATVATVSRLSAPVAPPVVPPAVGFKLSRRLPSAEVIVAYDARSRNTRPVRASLLRRYSVASRLACHASAASQPGAALARTIATLRGWCRSSTTSWHRFCVVVSTAAGSVSRKRTTHCSLPAQRSATSSCAPACTPTVRCASRCPRLSTRPSIISVVSASRSTERRRQPNSAGPSHSVRSWVTKPLQLRAVAVSAWTARTVTTDHAGTATTNSRRSRCTTASSAANHCNTTRSPAAAATNSDCPGRAATVSRCSSASAPVSSGTQRPSPSVAAANGGTGTSRSATSAK